MQIVKSAYPILMHDALPCTVTRSKFIRCLHQCEECGRCHGFRFLVPFLRVLMATHRITSNEDDRVRGHGANLVRVKQIL